MKYASLTAFVERLIFCIALHYATVASNYAVFMPLDNYSFSLHLPTFCLLFVATSDLMLEVFAWQLLLSGIVFPLTSVLAKLTTFHRHLNSHLFHSTFATA